MNHKVILRSVFVLALALGLATVRVRIQNAPDAVPPPVAAATADSLARPLASYRVYETGITGGMDFRGAGYKGRVSEAGTVFGPVPELNAVTADREFSVEFGSPRIEQGSVRLECEKGKFVRPAFGVGQIDRGAVVEEYLFENRRIEQIYRFPVALAEGPLRLSIPVKTDLAGPVVAHPPAADAFVDMIFRRGGLAFCDASGKTMMAYHTAVAIDAKGREIALAPRHENNEIVLEVPAAFMAKAEYPLVIDPWLDFLGSGAGGGVSNNTGTSQNPSLALTAGGQPFIAWADNSAAGANPNNTDIYMKWWNGFEFRDLGGSSLPGGISATSGKSVNPSLSLGEGGSPIIAWEDDSSGAIGIMVRKWPLLDEPGVGAWTQLAGSGQGSGITANFSPAQHPSVTGVMTVIPGVVSVDAQGNIQSTPSKTFHSPVVVFDLPSQFGGTQIFCTIFYPGAPAQPITPINPAGLPVIPEGWYPLGVPGGVGVTKGTIVSISNTPTGALSQYPSITVNSLGRVAVAWQDTRNGNYEIYFREFQAGAGLFEVRPQVGNEFNAMDLFPVGNFVALGGSFPGGGVSNTARPSQFPSLAADIVGATQNYTIAWEETEAAAPPNPGTTSQIYVARSVNGAAFAGLAGSTGVGGISQTLNRATNPSIDVGGNYIGVAWADDSNGRSSIYARRFFLAGGVSWEQIGFQGSAFPAIGVEPNAVIDGFTKSANFAIQPKIKLDQFGSPIVAWSDGAGAAFDIRLKVFSPNGPGIASNVGTPTAAFNTSLRQTLTDPRLGPATDVAVAGFGNITTIWLSSRVFTETLNPAGQSVRLEIEVQPAGAPFTNSPNFQTLFVAPDDPTLTPSNLAVLRFEGLPNFNYHWQARSIDQIGRSSPWILFPDNGGVSFRINDTTVGGGGPPNTTPVAGAGAGRSKGSCGLTGLEAVALLGVAALIRRRRAT